MRQETSNLIQPVLTYAVGLREQLIQGKELDLEEVQAVLKGLLGHDLEPATTTDLGGSGLPIPAHAANSSDNKFQGIRYALVCWLDEWFIDHSPWRALWIENILERQLYGTRDRSWKFWEQVRHADLLLASDAPEAFLQCVMLGFRGDLRAEPKRLAGWVRSVQARRARQRQRPAHVLQAHALPPALPALLGSQRWLWRFLGMAQETSLCPEIDEAWQEALVALQAADIDSAATPLFLVLGRTQGGEEAFISAAFATAPSSLRVRNVPARAEAPLHVFATRDAIYVMCPDACMLGRQAELLAGTTAAKAHSGSGVFPARRPRRELATLDVPVPGTNDGSLASTGRAVLGPIQQWATTPSAGEIGRDATIREVRLRRLCRLLVRDRCGGAPLNGMLLLLPYAATANDEYTYRTGLACRRDVAVVREAAQLRCPLLAVVCDLEQAPGLTTLVERFPAKQRHHRLGQSYEFSWPSDLPNTAQHIREGVRWLSEDLVLRFIQQFWQPETPEQLTFDKALEDGIQLHRFWWEIRHRQDRLGLLFTSCVPEPEADPEDACWFGGSYLAATGRKSSEQAFVAGVVQKLFECRKWVSWTKEALDKDSMYRRWSSFAFAACTLLILTVALLLWWG
jgi:hypothetical protein